MSRPKDEAGELVDNERFIEMFARGARARPSEREALIEELRVEDPVAAERLSRLWAVHEEVPDGFLAGGSREATTPFVTELGGYRLIEELGRGSMGVVYRAQQEQPRREVALKIVRLFPNDDEAARRLEKEAAVLAKLQHPGIAQVFDAGTGQVGNAEVPYFAMELIEGRPVDAYIEEANAPVEARLRLFAEICDAIDFAHQRGIIHRDLKPANILVTELPARSGPPEPRPKILDFGVARTLTSDKQASTMHTQAGALVGTVGYMSPEQLSGDGAKVDARSDVYALGVLLFRLLSGRMPFALDGLHLARVVELVSSVEPPSLSTINGRYRGDIEIIVGKAIERDPARRYASAAELAEDVRRHLSRQPIRARAPSPLYRLSKLAHRNGAVAMGALAVLLALIAGPALLRMGDGLIDAAREQVEVSLFGDRKPDFHWTFDDASLADLGPTRLHAVGHGDFELVEDSAPVGVANRAALRTGENAYVVIPHHESIDFDTYEDFSISVWVKARPQQLRKNEDNDIVEKWSGNAPYPYVIRIYNHEKPDYDGVLVGARFDERHTAAVRTQTRVDDGRWHHVALVRRRRQLNLYLDGVLEESALDPTTRTTRNTSPLFVGRRGSADYVNPFTGLVDDLRIYRVGLYPSEVRRLAGVQ